MARTIEPPLDPSNPDLDVATAVMGNRTKNLIVRHLWVHGPTKGPDLVKAIELQGPTVFKAIASLEEWGVVSANIPAAERRGRVVTYSVDRDRIQHLVELWFAFVTGGDSPS